tara:strand:- start:319 stop:576 length:258 start_codon:yes stop_codon:yes gene_type:complete
MKIVKELKRATFVYDEEDKSFLIKDSEGQQIILNKVYAFALMRFIVRLAQRNWLRLKPAQKNQEINETKEPEDIENPNQLNFLDN